MPRIGLSLPLVPQSVSDAISLGRDATRRGVREFWLPEVGGADAYVFAGALSQAVDDATIGTAVVPAQSRTPMAHAMAAATLSEMTGGRFVLGVGISSENIVAGWAGQPFDRPLRRMREHVEVLRRLLDGEKVDYDGETLSVHRYRVATRVVGRVPIYLGALNPGMLRLAGARCDGVVLNMVHEDKLAMVLAEVRAGAEAAGRDPDEIEVVSRIHVHVTDEPEGFYGLVRNVFGAYAATSGYNRYFRWVGFEEEASRIADAWERRDRSVVASAMSDAMCEAVAVFGPADTVRARLRAYAENGVDVIALNPIWPDPAMQLATLDACWDVLDGLADDGTKGVMRATRSSA